MSGSCRRSAHPSSLHPSPRGRRHDVYHDVAAHSHGPRLSQWAALPFRCGRSGSLIGATRSC